MSKQTIHTTARDSSNRHLEWRTYPTTSRLYYEAHITVPPLTPSYELILDQLCAGTQWHRSTFELQKAGEVPNGFVSARADTREEIMRAMGDMLLRLQNKQFPVLRFKVEDTLLDSKRGDTLEVDATQRSTFGAGLPDEPAAASTT